MSITSFVVFCGVRSVSTSVVHRIARHRERHRSLHLSDGFCKVTCVTSKTVRTTIVSIGYEKRDVNTLIGLLTDNDVSTLVDVRLNPISRKKGFSKTALATALNEAGIEYRHERQLGNPKENRDPFRQGLMSAREEYQNHLMNGSSAVYHQIIDLAFTTRIALLCFELDHDQCHRSCILETALTERPAIEILKL